MNSRDVVEQHRAAGRRFEAAGIGSLVREAGPPAGQEPVVCLHGVPASCFLYRKDLRSGPLRTPARVSETAGDRRPPARLATPPQERTSHATVERVVCGRQYRQVEH